jgi:hypothetical protein
MGLRGKVVDRMSKKKRTPKNVKRTSDRSSEDPFLRVGPDTRPFCYKHFFVFLISQRQKSKAKKKAVFLTLKTSCVRTQKTLHN